MSGFELDDPLYFPKGHTELSRDKRPISHITWPDNATIRVGEIGITRIEAYDENGHMGMIPWLAIIKDDQIASRVMADQVMVSYVIIEEVGEDNDQSN